MNKHKLGWTKASRQGVYCRARWLKLREYILNLEPLCIMCKDKGKVVPATVVDHIKAIDGEEDPLFYEVSNLQSLCVKCHVRKTRRDNSKYSRENRKRGDDLRRQMES